MFPKKLPLLNVQRKHTMRLKRCKECGMKGDRRSTALPAWTALRTQKGKELLDRLQKWKEAFSIDACGVWRVSSNPQQPLPSAASRDSLATVGKPCGARAARQSAIRKTRFLESRCCRKQALPYPQNAWHFFPYRCVGRLHCNPHFSFFFLYDNIFVVKQAFPGGCWCSAANIPFPQLYSNSRGKIKWMHIFKKFQSGWM